jgi:methylated-DNA-[protein]-cysteine S-methyltransferase
MQYALFETAIGICGIAWSEGGLTRLQLPEADRDATEQRLHKTTVGGSPGVPPPQINRTIADIQRYATGRKTDFLSVAIDWTGISSFHRSIYVATRAVSWGQTASYGELAQMIGSPAAARAVGQALGRNPVPIIVPCHRILAKGDRLRGFSAYGGIVTKERLLVLEGLRLV